MARRRFQQTKIEQRSNGTFFIRPYVDVVKPDGSLGREKRVVDLEGCKTKVEAKKLAAEKMNLINQPKLILSSQVTMNHLIDVYVERHIEKSGEIGYAADKKYRSLIKNHIRPAFGELMLSEVTPLVIQEWFSSKRETLSWASRMDIRNVISGIFERAEFWQMWQGKNPVKGVKLGRKEAVYERVKWSKDQVIRFFHLLPQDVSLLCLTGFSTGFRVSELLGIRERNLDPVRSELNIEERYYRGDIDRPKTANSKRTVRLAPALFAALQSLCTGKPDNHLFRIRTNPVHLKGAGTWCRDDRSIHRYFVKPVAKELGLYRKGFGFHELRREAATYYADLIGMSQAQDLLGHGAMRMTEHYIKRNQEAIQQGMGQLLNILGADLAPAIQAIQ